MAGEISLIWGGERASSAAWNYEIRFEPPRRRLFMGAGSSIA
jgi:hypothetical protein